MPKLRKYPREWLEQIPAEVFGCLLPGELRIILLPGSGMANGGASRDVPIDLISVGLRVPNTKLLVDFDDNWNVIRVSRRDG